MSAENRQAAQGAPEAEERWAALSEGKQAEELKNVMAELSRQLERMEGNLQKLLRHEEEMKKGGLDHGGD